MLSNTDPRLLWERARALYDLGEAWALKGEIERACQLLAQAAELTTTTGDRRGLREVVRIRNRHLGRWRSDPHVRELDETIRVASSA